MLNKKTIKKILVAVVIAAFSIYEGMQQKSTTSPSQGASSKNTSSKNHKTSGSLQAAFNSKKSDFQIQDAGVIVKVLPDDLKGSRHQKFILKSRSGATVLIAHNIDLAPKIKTLREGDRLEFFGEYEWNPRGGVVHWTHHDPKGYHVSGWLKHNGKTYQ